MCCKGVIWNRDESSVIAEWQDNGLMLVKRET